MGHFTKWFSRTDIRLHLVQYISKNREISESMKVDLNNYSKIARLSERYPTLSKTQTVPSQTVSNENPESIGNTDM